MAGYGALLHLTIFLWLEIIAGMNVVPFVAPAAPNTTTGLPRCFAEMVEDYSNWPVSPLCKTCHDKWHELVTPYLPGRGSTSLAQYTIQHYLRSLP